MKAMETNLPEVMVLEPRVFSDARGHFFEAFQIQRFEALTGVTAAFVQDNQSRSNRGVLRGLHYQLGEHPQGKLVRALSGEIFDVAVDIRRSSPRFGQWTGVHLSGDNLRQLWIPGGFAHGFLVLSEQAEVLYKVTDFYAPEEERTIRWDDPEIAIEWPKAGCDPVLSDKDAAAPKLGEAETFD